MARWSPPTPPPDTIWSCNWTTVQELLEDKGVSWKVYTPSNVGVSGRFASLTKYLTWGPDFYDPIKTTSLALTDDVLRYFTAFRKPGTPLFEKAFKQTFPNDFAADVKSGKFPKVSWIIPPLGFDEHPSASPTNGQWFVSMVLRELTSNPKVWSKTALFIMYDENDGWFDHVPPPTAPKGTAGEYLTTSKFPTGEPHPETLDINGPLGLGVRVPLLVVSPFSRGGHIATEVFDHTSQLKLIAKRFGVEVPNVSAWRRKTVGDLTSTLFHSKKDASVPKLPKTSIVFASSGPASYRRASSPNREASVRASRPSSGCPTSTAEPTRRASSSSSAETRTRSPTRLARRSTSAARRTRRRSLAATGYWLDATPFVRSGAEDARRSSPANLSANDLTSWVSWRICLESLSSSSFC